MAASPNHVAVTTTADSFPPEANHRYATPGGPSCATCKFFSRGVCTQWQAPTGQTQVCDSYEPLRNAPAMIATRTSRYTDVAKRAAPSGGASTIPGKQ